jgi:GNAT superfamily N-acetyltransferase
VLARAFVDYPVWQWLIPDRHQREGVMPWFMSMSLRYGLRAGEVYTAGAPLSGVAVWERFGDDDTGDDGEDPGLGWAEVPARLGDAGMARLNAMIETQRPARDRVSGGAPARYLPWLGVEPGLQRTGIGAALLRDMFARADAEGIPCMLETEQEANVPYYERHGFAVAEHGVLPLDGPAFWTMRREPAVQTAR